MAVADICGAFLHAVLEKHFFVTPPAEYRKLGVVWKIKRYLYGDKRAPRWWQDHFEKTMLELGFERLESEPSCFVKKRQLLCATGENVETQACRVRWEWQVSVVLG